MKHIMSLLLICVYAMSMNAQDTNKNTPVSVDPRIKEIPTFVGDDVPPIKGTPLPPSDDGDDRNPVEFPPVEFPKEAPKRIIWGIHGLGGDKDSWSRVQSYINTINPGKVISPKLTYTEDVTLQEAATEPWVDIKIKNDIYQPQGYDPMQTFLIAHSQGGLVSRSMDTYMPGGQFGGFATFGSPHKGAWIINNKAQLGQFGASTALDLAAGPAKEEYYKIFPNNKIFDYFFLNVVNNLSGITDKALAFGNKYIPSFIDGLAANTFSPITNDYVVGAPALAALGSNPKVKKVCFVGIEDEPVSYREIYNAAIKLPNAFDLWGADYDQALVDDANETLSDYTAKYLDYLNKANSTNNYKRKVKYQNLKNAFYHGVHSLNNMNDNWKHIIGGLSFQPTGQASCTCKEKGDHGWVYYTYPGPCGTNNIPTCVTNTGLGLVSKASDGLVLVENQTFDASIKNMSMPGSNHQQMRNDSNTKWAIQNQLLGGKADLYFLTK